MPNTNLNASEVEQAKAWLSDIYVLAGQMDPVRPADYARGYNWPRAKACITNAQHICKVINSSLFEDIDADIEKLSKIPYVKLYGESENSLEKKGITVSTEIARPRTVQEDAKLLSIACAAMDLVWDPANSTEDEVNDFTDSQFGMALQNLGLIKADDTEKTGDTSADQASVQATTTSQPTAANSTASQPSTVSGTATTAASTMASTTTTANTASQSTASQDDSKPDLMNHSRAEAVAAIKAGTWKSSGPQSANARDLKGKPGEKITVNGEVYLIQGVTKSNVLFVDTILDKGAAGNTNKLAYGSGHGYSDSTCFFETPEEADAFLLKAKAKNLAKDAIVKHKKAASNGYFKVGTEFGDCLIAANKLNEKFIVDDKESEPEEEPLHLEPKKSAFEQFMWDSINAD